MSDPKLIKYNNQFWQPITIVDTLGGQVDLSNISDLQVNESGQLRVVLDGTVDSNNSTNVNLGIDEVFIGEASIILDYAIIFITIFSDVESAIDGLTAQISSDGITWRDSDHFNIPANIERTFSFQPNKKYFRVKYTNGGIAQTIFDMQTVLKRTNSKPSNHRIQDIISSDDDATLQKSILTGQKPDGTFSNTGLSGFSNLKVAIEEIVSDAFGRQKVSLPTSLLDSVIEHDVENFYINFLTSGGAETYNYDAINKRYTLNVINDGEYVVLQTIHYGKYQPGKSLEFTASLLINTENGIIKRCGYCNVINIGITPTNLIQNGIYFENDEGILSWNVVKNGILTEKSLQKDWNIDVLDGTGASSFVLNVDYVQLPYIDLQFLAVGTIRVGFNINGKDVICHKFYHSNTNNFIDTYMQSANLPVHYSITSKGGSGSMKTIGYAVTSGGGFDPLGSIRFIDTDSINISNRDTELIVGLRLKDTYYDSFVKILSVEILGASNANCKWMLLLNPTYTGTVNWIDLNNSSIQYASNNNNIITSKANRGIELASGFMSNNNDNVVAKLNNALRIAKRLDGTFDEIWLAIQSYGNETFYGIINFKDLF